jgi:hypothetical protein
LNRIKGFDGATGVTLALAAAAGIHVAVIGEHFGQSTLFGIFFVAVSLVQFLQALAGSLQPTRRLWLAIGLSNLAVIGIWLASRTIGLPVGPDGGAPEPVGLLDAATVGLEILAVVGAARLRVGRRHGSAGAPRITLAAGVALMTLLAGGIAFAVPPAHTHATEHTNHSVSHDMVTPLTSN